MSPPNSGGTQHLHSADSDATLRALLGKPRAGSARPRRSAGRRSGEVTACFETISVGSGGPSEHHIVSSLPSTDGVDCS